MKGSPRGILVVHSDLSDRVARLVVGEIKGHGEPITRRNIRYGYFPEMYSLVLLIGVGDQPGGKSMSYEYVSYAEYKRQVKGEGLSRQEYHSTYASRIASKIVDSINPSNA